MGIAGLVLGIVATVFGAIGIIYISIPVGIIGIILAAIACKKEKKGVNTAGLVLSIIGTILGLILYLACYACAAAAVGGLM